MGHLLCFTTVNHRMSQKKHGSLISETDRHLVTIQHAKCYYRGTYHSGNTGEDLSEEMTSKSKGKKIVHQSK